MVVLILFLVYNYIFIDLLVLFSLFRDLGSLFEIYSLALFPSLILFKSKNIEIIDDPDNLVFKKKYFNLDNSFDQICKENKRKAGVYVFRSQFSKNFYVGSTIDLSRRFIEHFKSYGSNSIFQRAFRKHGTENFYFYILEYTDSNRKFLLTCEQKYLDFLNPIYNIFKVAGSPLGFKHFFSTRKKMSMVKSGDKHSHFEKTRSEQTRRKISQTLGTTILVYFLTNQLLYTFSSSVEAAKYLNRNNVTILNYAKLQYIFKEEYILSFEPLKSGLKQRSCLN